MVSNRKRAKANRPHEAVRSTATRGDRRVFEHYSRAQQRDLLAVSALLSEGKSQVEIARVLGKAPATINRRKQDAVACGVLRLAFHPPRIVALEFELTRLLAPFGVRSVLVFADHVAAGAARFFEEAIRDRKLSTVVLDGGRTISCFVDFLADALLTPLRVLPLCADPPSYLASAYESMTRLKTMFPHLVECEKLPHLVTPVLRQEHRRIQQVAARADIVLLGCGPWEADFTASEFVRNLGMVPSRIRNKFKNVSSVCGYCALTDCGVHVPLAEVDVLMPRSLSFTAIRALARQRDKHVVLLAGTATKTHAVMDAVRGRMPNTLILDENLAGSLCNHAKNVRAGSP